MKILVTGNYSTGSSAVYDYLKEFDNIYVPFHKDDYEHTIFYMPNGLFDLEATLFGNVGYIAQDAAIRSFLKMSNNLYKYNYKYYGGFKKKIGPEFLKMTNEFVSSISTTFQARTIGKNEKMRFSFVKACGQLLFSIFKGYKIESFGMAYKESKGPGYVLSVDKKTFDIAKSKYISRYLELTSKNGFDTLYDHLLLPINASQIVSFPKDTKLIVVDRDPRDVYCLMKKYRMVSAKFGFEKPPFPIDNVENFATSFINFRRNEKEMFQNENVLFIHFEDMIGNYTEIMKKINDFLSLDEKHHVSPKKYFDPSISVNNIQLFKQSHDDSIKYIEENLSKYLFDFSKYDFNSLDKKKNDVF